MKNMTRMASPRFCVSLLLLVLLVFGSRNAHGCDALLDTFVDNGNPAMAFDRTPAFGFELACNPSGPSLRLDVGALHAMHATGTSAYTELTAGAPFAYGSWRAGARHATASRTSYFGSAIVNTDIRPLAFEARWQNDDGIWKTWLSAGVHLFASDTMELALGFSQLEGVDDLRRRLMLKFTGEF